MSLSIILEGLAPKAGSPAGSPIIGAKRPLTAVDLVARTAPAIGDNPLQRIRYQHHQIARLLASGLGPTAVSRITGMTMCRISVLKSDPTFRELLVHYAQMEEEAWATQQADMRERLKALGFDSIEILHEKLQEEPQAFKVKDLLQMVELTADRTGHGKVTSVNATVTHGVDPAVLERVKSAAGAAPVASEEDRRALVSYLVRATDEHSEVLEAERGEGGGYSVRAEGDEGAGGAGS